jgi:hypothetical protein
MSSKSEFLLFMIICNRLPKDYHKENMHKMRKNQHDIKHKIEEEKNKPKCKGLKGIKGYSGAI